MQISLSLPDPPAVQYVSKLSSDRFWSTAMAFLCVSSGISLKRVAVDRAFTSAASWCDCHDVRSRRVSLLEGEPYKLGVKDLITCRASTYATGSTASQLQYA